LPYGVGESRPKSNFPDDISYEGDDTYLQVENEILEGGASSSQYYVPLSYPEGFAPRAHMPADLFMRLTDNPNEHWPPDIAIRLRGIVRYRDASQKAYWTEFRGTYSPNLVTFPKSLEAGRFYLGYKDSEERAEKTNDKSGRQGPR